MNASKEELLDQYIYHLRRLYFAVIEHSKEQLPVITAIEENRSGVREIQEQFQVLSDLQQLKLEKDKARKAFDESGPHEGQLAQRVEEFFEIERSLDAGVEQLSIVPPVNVGIGGISALERDPSGEKTDQFIKDLFGVDFAKQRVVIRGDENRSGSARHIGRRVALKLFSRDVFDRIETFCGKGKTYFAKTLWSEQRRNIRDEEIEDRNYLGGTPKESRHLSKADRELIRAANQAAADTDDPAIAAKILASDNPEEIALALDDMRQFDAILDLRSPELPCDQRALLKRWRAGESPTEARRELGFPASTESALRNKLKRWGREWKKAQQASLESSQKNLSLA